MTLIDAEIVNSKEYEIALDHEVKPLVRENWGDPDNILPPIDETGFAQYIGSNRSPVPRPCVSGAGKSGIRETEKGMTKFIGKLEKFFAMAKKKQRKKHNKLSKIINKLEKKQDRLKAELEQESDSKRYHDLLRKLDVISELIRNAKLKECSF